MNSLKVQDVESHILSTVPEGAGNRKWKEVLVLARAMTKKMGSCWGWDAKVVGQDHSVPYLIEVPPNKRVTPWERVVYLSIILTSTQWK